MWAKTRIVKGVPEDGWLRLLGRHTTRAIGHGRGFPIFLGRYVCRLRQDQLFLS
jgi:hypothetical protein